MLQEFYSEFWREEVGQDMVEYSLLLSFIIVAAVAILTSIRVQIVGYWSTVTSALSSAMANAS
jgi:Flp pilus assembly pilin Flp